MEPQPIHMSIKMNITTISVNPIYFASLIVALRGYTVPSVSITLIFNLASVP